MLFDRLTGTLKKEVFEYLLEKEIERATRYRSFFSLASIELDRLDNNGNGNGRGVRQKRADLKALGNILREELRSTDILGWEKEGIFWLVLLETDEEGAKVVGERVRRVIEEIKFNQKARSVSVGIVSFPAHSLELSDMLQGARNRLVRAKARGGNQVCISDEGVLE